MFVEKKAIDFFNISAEYLSIYDLTDKAMYYDLDGDYECFPTNLTMFVNALVALKYCKLDDEFVVGDEQIVLEEFMDPSKAFLEEGQKWTLRELLYFMFLNSASDAAYAVGYNVMNSLSEYDSLSMNKKLIKYVDLMNDYAYSIGCKNTHFVTLDGSDYVNGKVVLHLSSTNDLIKILAEVFNYPELVDILKTKVKVQSSYGSDYYLKHKIRCMHEDDEFYCEHIIGGICGTNNLAGDCILCAGEGEGHIFLIAMVCAHSSDLRFKDTKTIFDSLFGE